MSHHYNSSPQPQVFLRPPTFTFSFLTFKKLRVACRRRDWVHGPVISGFIFRVRCGFLREMCVRRTVTKHRNSYERGRSISEKQVALPYCLWLKGKRQEVRVRRLKYQREFTYAQHSHSFFLSKQIVMVRNLPRLSLKRAARCIIILMTIHNSFCAIIKRERCF